MSLPDCRRHVGDGDELGADNAIDEADGSAEFEGRRDTLPRHGADALDDRARRRESLDDRREERCRYHSLRAGDGKVASRDDLPELVENSPTARGGTRVDAEDAASQCPTSCRAVSTARTAAFSSLNRPSGWPSPSKASNPVPILAVSYQPTRTRPEYMSRRIGSTRRGFMAAPR